MTKRIPVAAAKRFAQENGLSQVIIIGQGDASQHIVTYGVTKEDCRLAAISGDNLKRHCGWPESTISKYSKATAL